MATLGYSDIKMQMVPLSPFAFSSLISEADIRKETSVALLFTRYIGILILALSLLPGLGGGGSF